MDTSKTFASKDEEIAYWKNLAQKYKRDYDDTKEELEEFQTSSHELEQELETQLRQEEKKVKELALSTERLQNECDTLRDKLQKLQTDSHNRVTELEDSYARVEAHRNELQKYIRELEQDNDDLERAKRATVVSLEDFEQRLNQAIERNAFLESELDEKGALFETVQRLKDEARDLKSEIDVRQQKDTVLKPSAGDGLPVVPKQQMQDSGYAGHGTSPPTPSTPISRALSVPGVSNGTTGTPLTPSARISALNIVGDLLRKVGIKKMNGLFPSDPGVVDRTSSIIRQGQKNALESKLATCRNFMRDDPRNKPGGASPVNSPRVKCLNKDLLQTSGRTAMYGYKLKGDTKMVASYDA